MKASIFCRTYDKDAAWLAKSLPTWKGKGYDEILVTGIDKECEKVKKVCEENEVEFRKDIFARRIPNGYINQQYTKLRADLYMKADHILFVDADTICFHEHQPRVWFNGDKPIMLYSDWDNVGQAVCWRTPTSAAIGKPAKHEYMRRLPLLYRRDTIRETRERIESLYNKDLLDYLHEQKTFSEFNAIGHYAWTFQHEAYDWVNPEEDYHPFNPFKQFWSHGDMGEQITKYEAERTKES